VRAAIAERCRAESKSTASRFSELQPDRWMLIGGIISLADLSPAVTPASGSRQ
jgi:hypothetical protein